MDIFEMKPDERDKAKYKVRSELAIKLITSHPEYLPLIKDKYRTDDILEEALQLEPDVFRYIKNPSDKLIEVALDLDGSNIRFLSKHKIRELPEDVLIIALNSYDEAISYIDCSELSELTRVKIFLNDPITALENGIEVPESCVITAVTQTPNMIRYIPHASEDIKCAALSVEPNVALYFDKLTDRMMDIIDEKYPYLRDRLPNYTRTINEEEKTNGTSSEE